MTSSVLTSDRYIAIVDKSGNVAFNGTVRIFSKGGTITPAKWNPAHKRLESVALNRPAAADVALPMYEMSARLDLALFMAGISFRWLTAEEAQELTA